MAVRTLIVIEGSDGAGKETQATMLRDALSCDYPTAYFDFPRYAESLSGALVGRCLAGEFGDFVAVPPELAALPYAVDRAAARPAIEEALEKGVVICNRYTPSNLAHQSAKLPTQEDRDRFVAWLEAIEYDELGIPRPSLVCYLYVPLDIADRLTRKKKARAYLGGVEGKLDDHERNLSFLRASVDQFRRLAATKPDWVEISCAEGGEILPIGVIHAKIRAAVRDRLGI